MMFPKLFIPGPTNVREEVLAAQTHPMIGHRTDTFEHLFARVQEKLRRLFFTRYRVYVTASSGTGLQEAAIRNGVRRRVLAMVNGAFSQRWHDVAVGCGKEVVRVDIPWGQAVKPEHVVEAIEKHGPFDAVTIVHNETSTGVMSPVGEIARAVRRVAPDTFIFVDAVSSLSGVPIPVDEWGLDVTLTSSQKAMALPPGLAFAAVSDRVLERAKEVEGRGWYFDFLILEKYLQRNTTPATPAISLFWALDRQLDIMFAEGLENRFARHARMAEMTRRWARERGFDLFAEEGYASQTVTCVRNTRGIDVVALNAYLREQGMTISNGYGSLKGKTFRIAHMGETTEADMESLFRAMDAWLEGQ